MEDKVSIVMTALNYDLLQVNITCAALGNIAKYTDRNKYELILVEQKSDKTRDIPDLNRRHNSIDIDKHIKIDHEIGMSAAMNLGYKKSNPEYKYICFIHNDVFVWEGWLDRMFEQLNKRSELVFMPVQAPYKREDILNLYKEEDPTGNDDAGMMIMTKETFVKTGGWDERFRSVCQDAAFRARLPRGYIATGKVIITHIGSINMYSDEQRDEEGELYQKLKDYNLGKDINYLL